MGARLIKKAYVFAVDTHLTGNEMKLLVWMALKALDDDPRPRYFAAREDSAISLGERIPDEPDPAANDEESNAARAVRRAAFQRLKVAFKGLLNKGAIACIRHGRAGQRAEYELTFGHFRVDAA